MNVRRIIISTVLGFVCGIVCWNLAASNNPLAWYLSASIVLNRMLLGFGIGISNWKMPWWLHGIVMGIIFSIPMAFSSCAAPEKQLFIFIGTIVMGIIYGIVIELVTSVIFKAKQT